MASAHHDELVGNAMRGLSALVSMQMVSRIFSFALKILSARILGPQQFAFSEVQVTLLVALILLPSREGFRKIAIRTSSIHESIALSWLASLVSFILSILTCIYMTFDKQQRTFNPSIHSIALCITAIAASIEGVAEPFLVASTKYEQYHQVAMAKSMSLIVGSVLSLIALNIVNQQYRPLASVLGPLTFSLTYTTWLAISTAKYETSRKVPSQHRYCIPSLKMHKSSLVLVVQQMYQALVRFMLGDGESVILLMTCTEAQQGAFKLSSNIASLVARFFLEPLEEQCFAVFSQLNAKVESAPMKAQTDKPFIGSGEDIDNNTDTNTEADKLLNQKQVVQTMESTLAVAIKTGGLVTSILACIGPFYAYLIIYLFYGTAWADETDAPRVLSFYFTYVAIMAINGVTEAFLNATASASQQRRYALYTTIISLLYLLLAFELSNWFGVLGLIVSNAINMVLRISYCSVHISSYFGVFQMASKTAWIKESLPRPATIASFFVMAALAAMTRKHLLHQMGLITQHKGIQLLEQAALPALMHVGVGFLSLIVIFMVVRTFEVVYVSEFQRMYSSRKRTKRD